MTLDELPDDFDWADLPSPITVDSGPTHTELPSVLQPWDDDEIRALRGFAREAIRERAHLALTDPNNERDSVAPLSSVRARWILLTLTEDDSNRALLRDLRRSTVIARGPTDRRESGRDLLTRLGAEPTRDHGVIRCPAHEDKRPSLSWKLAPDGRALVHCFRGCTFAEILAAAA